jgi:lipopolysaccharide cholinephosphotransferase
MTSESGFNFMLKSSYYMNELAKNSEILHQLKETERDELRTCLLEIFNDVVKVCEKYHLTIMVCGGTALGAVRHYGFIPWDDDLDVMMPRKDYDRLLELFEDELSWGYYLYAPNTKYGAINTFAKIMKKNTTMIDLYNINTIDEKGIFVDVFPIENTPNNALIRILKGIAADVFAFMAVSTRMYATRNKLIEEYVSANRKSLINYKIRLSIGAVFSFLSYNKWYNLYDKFVRTRTKGDYFTIPTGRKHYRGEIIKGNDLFPPSEGVFEGLKVMLPHKPDVYLNNLYGDYMQIPPPEKRERHYFVGIDFNEETLQ